MIHLNLN